MALNKKVIVTVLAALVSFYIYAQESKPAELELTVEQAVELAIKESIKLKQDQLDLDTARRDLQYADTTKYPSLSLGASANAGIGTGTVNDFSVTPSAGTSVSASGSWTFVPQVETTIKGKEIALETKEISYETSKRSLEKSIRNTYYSLLYTKENIEQSRSTLEASRRQNEAIETRYKRGNASQLELLNSQLAVETNALNLRSAENNYASSLRSFKITLGIPNETQVKLTGQLSSILTVDLDKLSINYQEGNSLTVKNLEKNLENAENTLKSLHLQSEAPTVSVSVSESITPASWSLAKMGDDWKNTFRWLTTNTSGSVSVRIPVDRWIPGLKDKLEASYENQIASIEKIKLTIEQQKQSEKSTIEGYISSLRQYKEQIENLKKTIEIAQKTYDLTKESYDHGVTDFNTLQDKADVLVKYRVQMLNYAYQIEGVILNLEDSLGVPFGTLLH